MSEKKPETVQKPERRKFLGYAAAAIVSSVVTGAGVWALTPKGAVEVTKTATVTEAAATVTKTETAAPVTVTKTATVTTPVTLTPTPTPTPTLGATPEERAINAAIEYIKQNPDAAGYQINILLPAGGEGHFTEEIVAEWREATGTKINLIPIPHEEAYPKLMTEAVEMSGAFDIVDLGPSLYAADAVEARVIADLTDWVNKYDPEIDHGACPWAEAEQKGAMKYKGRWIGLRSDWDIWITHYRKDLVTDPDEQKAFESEYGRPLEVPLTWKDYMDVLKFFYRPEDPNPVSGDKGLWGAWEYRSPFWGRFNFMFHYLSKGKYYFDDNMKPLIDGPEGVETVKEMNEAAKYMPPEVWTGDWTLGYPTFSSGKVFMKVSWTSLYKYSTNPEIAKLAQKGIQVLPALPPGEMLPDGKIRAIGYLCWAHLLTIDKYSKHSELAFLFLQYQTGPTQGAKMALGAGVYEPFRMCHFKDPATVKYWGNEFIEAMASSYDYFAPDLYLEGAGEYTDILDKNLQEAYHEMKTPEQALRDCAEAWEKTTERVGRDKQIAQWLYLKKGFGPKVAPLMSP